MPEDPNAAAGAALSRLQVDISPAESHGALAGLICGGAVDLESWLRVIGARAEPGDAVAAEGRSALAAMHETARCLFDERLFEFQPLLPADEAPLAERLAGLGEWCQGFLLGLAEAGVKDIDRLPGESAEAVRDLVEIAQVGSYAVEEGEEDEVAYSDLVEYVRTAVLLTHEELNPEPPLPEDGAPPTLH